jgi:peroxiredoxin
MLCACVISAPAQQAYPIQAAPTLRLKSVNGKTYDLAEMRGQVVVASFGATWCAPCHVELAALEQIKIEYKDKPVQFVWVSIESEADISNAVLRHRAKEMRLTMPVLRDVDQQVFSQFSSRRRLPMVVVFNAEGKLSDQPMFGMSDEETYKTRVRSKLNAALNAASAVNTATANTATVNR